MPHLILFLTLFLTLFTPIHAKRTPSRPFLTSIELTDRNGFTETLCVKEQLQNYSHINFLNPQPYEKVLRIYSRDLHGNIPAFLTTYYTSGQIQQYLEIQNSRALGLYQEWHPNGHVKLQAQILGGPADLTPAAQAQWVFDGIAHAFNEQGTLEASISYQKGKLHGPSTHFYPNGLPKWIENYDQGVRHGPQYSFYESQAPFEQLHFTHNLPDGIQQTFSPDGSLIAHEEFVHGQLKNATYHLPDTHPLSSTAHVEDYCGTQLLFSPQGLYESREIEDGIPYGRVETFSPQQQRTSSYFLRDGKKFGEETLYYEKSQHPKLIITWDDDQIHGPIKSFYKSGKLESIKEVVQNKKQGILRAYYESGDLMLIEEYDQDILIKGSYYAKGEQSPTSTIQNGQGIATLFDKKALFAKKIRYENGKPITSP